MHQHQPQAVVTLPLGTVRLSVEMSQAPGLLMQPAQEVPEIYEDFTSSTLDYTLRSPDADGGSTAAAGTPATGPAAAHGPRSGAAPVLSPRGALLYVGAGPGSSGCRSPYSATLPCVASVVVGGAVSGSSCRAGVEALPATTASMAAARSPRAARHLRQQSLDFEREVTVSCVATAVVQPQEDALWESKPTPQAAGAGAGRSAVRPALPPPAPHTAHALDVSSSRAQAATQQAPNTAAASTGNPPPPAAPAPAPTQQQPLTLPAKITDDICDRALAVEGAVSGVVVSAEALRALSDRDLDALSDYVDGLALHQSARLVQLLEVREELKERREDGQALVADHIRLRMVQPAPAPTKAAVPAKGKGGKGGGLLKLAGGGKRG
jgi:hypothetical protein